MASFLFTVWHFYIAFHDWTFEVFICSFTNSSINLCVGIHPKIAQERLGHSTITTTLDLYSHVTTTMQDDAAEKLNSAMRLAFKSKKLQTQTLG
jgi:hypothetical protein